MPHPFFPSLAEIPEPPDRLFVRGDLACTTNRKLIAIVGSRAFSPYGKQICEDLINALAPYPITIISGLAIGIDTIAHEAALANGIPTIAFPGSGLDDASLYPARNRDLAMRIIASGGALVSEFLPGTKALPHHFPRRNRLMAGASDLILVIEAAKGSGSLITAECGVEYNKIVCAVPGPVGSATAEGVNNLLKRGAVPVTCALDILRELSLA